MITDTSESTEPRFIVPGELMAELRSVLFTAETFLRVLHNDTYAVNVKNMYDRIKALEVTRS